MKVITIPNLDKYQHYDYKDRNIIWIKLYVDILQDYKFSQLTDRERWYFVALILLATKNKNQIPFDLAYIARESCYFAPEVCENGVRKVRKIGRTFRELSHGVLKLIELKLIAIKRIAKYKQNACLEKRREDKRREEDISSSKKPKRFYKGEEMRFSKGRWWVLPKDGGEWLEFAGDLKDTEIK